MGDIDLESSGSVPPVPVTPIGFERQRWRPSQSYGFTRRERANWGSTYQSAIPASIDDLRLELPSDVAADAEDAATEVARFDTETQHASGALTAILLRSESASSSQIEHITASARSVAEAELTGAGSTNAEVIVDNINAMVTAAAHSDQLTPGVVLELQRILLERHAPRLVGWRTEPVWIGGGSSDPVTADYVAPDHHHIEPAIDDLLRFASRNDLPLLPQIAITHAQFETIHPFPDGNGRTGRALIHLMLRSKGLAQTATVPISGGLLVERERYFAALTAYRAGDARPIIDQFTHATLRAIHQGRQLTDQVSVLREAWRSTINARADSSVWQVVELLPAYPVLDAETVARHTGIHPNNVARSLKPLIDAGILIGHQHFKSHKYLYRAPTVLALLDDYAAEVGRRQP